MAVADSFDAMTSGRRYRDDGGKVLHGRAAGTASLCRHTVRHGLCHRVRCAIETGEVTLLPRTDRRASDDRSQSTIVI